MPSLPDIDARINDVWLEAKLSGVERAILRDLIAVRGYLERYGRHLVICAVTGWVRDAARHAIDSGKLYDAPCPKCTCGWTEINNPTKASE